MWDRYDWICRREFASSIRAKAQRPDCQLDENAAHETRGHFVTLQCRNAQEVIPERRQKQQLGQATASMVRPTGF